jgi:NAD-dependent SIR2 family protein deacetylase
MLTKLARFTPPVVLPGDAAFMGAAAAERPPTADEILAALAELEKTPYTTTAEEVERQYDLERLEFEESEDTFRAKVGRVAELIRKAKYLVVYTGAGCSTSAGIPDFRSPTGVWTLRDKGKDAPGKDFSEASPNYTYYAITELARRGHVRFVCTTNMDSFHARAGLPLHMLEELHGSCYTEVCSGCRARYRRSEEIARGSPDHRTGNMCDFCGKETLDTIVNFSDTYRDETEPLITEFHAKKADLALVLGTSMCVQPAAIYPLKVITDDDPATPSRSLVIVNLQATPSDDLATVRVFAKVDAFMHALMDALGYTDFDQQSDARPTWAEQPKAAAAAAKKKKAPSSKTGSWWPFF